MDCVKQREKGPNGETSAGQQSQQEEEMVRINEWEKKWRTDDAILRIIECKSQQQQERATRERPCVEIKAEKRHEIERFWREIEK